MPRCASATRRPTTCFRGPPLGKVWPSDEEEAAAVDPTPTRIVEIGRTPAPSVPGCLAALEGVDLGDLELAEGHRALLAELPAEKEGWAMTCRL